MRKCRSGHFGNRSTPQFGGAYDQRLGAIAMPTVLDKLREIGKYVTLNAADVSSLPLKTYVEIDNDSRG